MGRELDWDERSIQTVQYHQTQVHDMGTQGCAKRVNAVLLMSIASAYIRDIIVPHSLRGAVSFAENIINYHLR